MFVCSGAFSELNDLMRFKYGEIDRDASYIDMNESFLHHAVTEDFVKQGIIRELIGRIHIRSAFDGLTQEDLCDILKTSCVKEEITNCALFGIDLVVTDCAIEAISRRATKDGTGARGLKGVLDKIVGPIKYENGGLAEEGQDNIKVVVDEKTCQLSV